MDVFNEQHFSGFAIDHLGLIADKIEDLGIISFIDERLSVQKGCGSKTTMGERIAAMILNGLGFIDTRLYMFPEFLEKKPVSRLFGKPLEPHWFNDDALGRCLDAISSYGTTKLFTELSFSIGIKKQFLGRSAHFDTSTLQVYGDYFEQETDVDTPIPAYGYSKSKRDDLKQMVINLATTGKANFPIWMEAHSGNSSDQKILPDAAERMHAFCQKLSNSPEFIYVGDSAMYSNILNFSKNLKWLTRVPEKILEAKKLVKKPQSEIDWHPLGDGYSYCLSESMYGNVQQRWVMIFSEQAYKRERKTLERKITSEFSEMEKRWWHLNNKLFSCPKDAANSAKKLVKKMKYHNSIYQVVEVMGHNGAGRPSKEQSPIVKGYKIRHALNQDVERIETEKNKKGRFILSTNELSKERLPDTEILKEYKAQSGTEGSFKFIKDDAFNVDSIFLKTPERISALMMVMTLCLMVYGVTQYELRVALQSQNDTIPDQTRKPTNKPSLKWVYFLFLGVHELTVMFGNKSQQIVINLNPVLKKIIGYFGPRAHAVYLNPA